MPDNQITLVEAIEGDAAAQGWCCPPDTTGRHVRELKELLTTVQRLVRRNRHRDANMAEMAVNAELYCVTFTAAWYLKALADVAPDRAAQACQEITGILDDGDAVGPLTWKLLSEMGMGVADEPAGPEGADPAGPAAAAEEPDYMATYRRYWAHLVETGEVLDRDKVARELHDYTGVLNEVAKAYDELTGSRVSKPHTAACHVVDLAQEKFAGDYAHRLCERAAECDGQGQTDTAQVLRDLAEQWSEGSWNEYRSSSRQAAATRASLAGGNR